MSNAQDEITPYQHTQKGPWWLLMYALAAVFLTVTCYVYEEPPLAITFGITGFIMFILGASIHWLTVADEGNRLVIRFGPFPLFRRRIWYDDIVDAEITRTTFLDGWGIHLSPRGGWVWNIWGYDCVKLRLKRGTLWLGTDDPQGLFELLAKRISKTA